MGSFRLRMVSEMGIKLHLHEEQPPVLHVNGEQDPVTLRTERVQIVEMVPPVSRVTSLDGTILRDGAEVVEAIGIPAYVDDVSQYAAYGITEKGWYCFARIGAPEGVTVSAETTVTGANAIVTEGADHVDAAVRFSVAAMAQTVTVTWAEGKTDTITFRASDLAVHNLDYRTTFYVYDVEDFAVWEYALTTDATFAAGKQYYTEEDGVYTLAEVTAGQSVPAGTYYNHSKLTLAGMVRNVTYKLDTIVDCPMEIRLPEVVSDGHGAWYEFHLQHSGKLSITLVPEEAGVKVCTAGASAAIDAGVNVVDLHYTEISGTKLWTLANVHSKIPT